MADGEINADVMLDSYAINDEQIVTGDSIALPQADGIVWNETDNLGLINTETGAIKHNKTAETVTLVQSYGGVDREYTLYVTGSEEEPYSINIDASDRSKDVSDDMWGLFFEDITLPQTADFMRKWCKTALLKRVMKKKDIYIIGDCIQYIKSLTERTANIIPPKIYRLKQINR